MNYSFGDIKEKQIIQKYEIVDNKIRVTFLDGKVVTTPYTQQYEEGLLQLMTSQAQQREDNNRLEKISSEKKYSKARLMAQSCNVVLYLGVMQFLPFTNASKNCFSIASGLFALSAILSAREIKDYIKEEKEIKKYSLYLKMSNDLKLIKDSYVYNEIETSKLPLNINTIDNFTLKEVQTISDNYEKINVLSKARR